MYPVVTVTVDAMCLTSPTQIIGVVHQGRIKQEVDQPQLGSAFTKITGRVSASRQEVISQVCYRRWLRVLCG